MKKGIIAFLLFSWLTPVLLAADQVELQEIQAEIESVRSEIQKSTASYLLIAKQIDREQAGELIHPKEQIVQITSREAVIRETDLETAPVLIETIEGDKFQLIEQRNDWFRVGLENNRVGWVSREQVQVIESEGGTSNPVSNDPRVRQISERLYEDIQDRYEQAKELFAEFDKIYANLSSSEKADVSNVHSLYLGEKEKIQTYMAYTNHYRVKFTSLPSTTVAAGSTGNQIGYQGTASLRFGSSSYEAMTQESTTSRNLNLNGAVVFSPQSRLNVNINHNNDIVQTPYTSNDVNLNFQHQTAGGTRLQGLVLYNSYNDGNVEANNFQNVGVGARVDHQVNAATRIYGDIRGNYKSYEVEDGNDFEGTNFNTGVNYNGGKAQVNAGVRGRLQNSDVSFLDYTRVAPNAAVHWLTGSGSFGVRTEAELLSYAAEAEANNFNRGRVDLEWSGKTNSTSLILIAKQYPNNEAFDNYRLRLQNQWNRTSGLGSARTALSLQYVYHPREETQLTNYVDLRFDRNSSWETAYFDLNLFGRYWEENNVDHQVNMFSRFGLKFSQFQIGPVIGAQLMLNPDDLAIERSGNTLRAGVDGRVNAVIQKATVYGSFRYQKSIIDSNAAESEVQERMPTTIEASAGLQVPLLAALDLKIDATYFNVNLDLPDISGAPVNSTQSGLRFLGGISYRFQR